MLNEETLSFIHKNRDADVRTLALRRAPEGVDLTAALQQIEGRQTAARKLPSWAAREDLFYPPRLSMEQCSSEQTARYKRELVRRVLQLEEGTPGNAMADLTGGFGIDFSFMAPLFRHAVYMERRSELCRIAAHNFSRLGLEQAEIREGDSSMNPATWPQADLYFIDPARRDNAGRKTVAIADCEPDLTALQDVILSHATYCLVKLSPMLDIREALRSLHHVEEVHAVSVQGECRELLFLLSAEQPTNPVSYHCADLSAGRASTLTFTAKEEENAECPLATGLHQYLYEPNASVMKCGGYRYVAARYNLHKLHPNSHLYTSGRLHPDFPGRVFHVESTSGLGKKELKAFLQDIPQANLTVRNFPATVAELRKRLHLREGGDTYIFATTLWDNRHVLIRCRK